MEKYNSVGRFVFYLILLLCTGCSESVEGTYINECTNEVIVLSEGKFTYQCKCEGKYFDVEGDYNLSGGNIIFEGAVRPCETEKKVSVGVIFERPIFSSLKFSFDHPDMEQCFFIKQ